MEEKVEYTDEDPNAMGRLHPEEVYYEQDDVQEGSTEDEE